MPNTATRLIALIMLLQRRPNQKAAELARELDVSRNTVRKYLGGEAIEPVVRRGPGRPRKLAGFEGWLRRRVKGAAPIRLPATVLHREVAAMGFDGSERTSRILGRICGAFCNGWRSGPRSAKPSACWVRWRKRRCVSP